MKTLFTLITLFISASCWAQTGRIVGVDVGQDYRELSQEEVIVYPVQRAPRKNELRPGAISAGELINYRLRCVDCNKKGKIQKAGKSITNGELEGIARFINNKRPEGYREILLFKGDSVIADVKSDSAGRFKLPAFDYATHEIEVRSGRCVTIMSNEEFPPIPKIEVILTRAGMPSPVIFRETK